MAANVFNTKSRAPAPPEIAHDDSSTASLIDVDSPHISSVSSDYQGETKTQVEREEHETEEAEREAREKFNQVSDETGKELREGKKEAHAKGKEAKHKAREVAHDANEKAKEAAREIKKDAKIAGQKAKEAGHEMDDRAREAGHDLKENRDNPVVIANALVIGLGSAALGYVITSQLMIDEMLTIYQLRCVQEVQGWRAQLASRWYVGWSDWTFRAW